VRAGEHMHQSHDRYSLAIVMEEHYPNAKAVISKIWSSEPLTNATALIGEGVEAPSD